VDKNLLKDLIVPRVTTSSHLNVAIPLCVLNNLFYVWFSQHNNKILHVCL